MIKSVLMSESNIHKFAKMLQVMRGMEADIGIGSLSKTDKVVFTSIADLITLSSKEVDFKDIYSMLDRPIEEKLTSRENSRKKIIFKQLMHLIDSQSSNL